MFFYSTKENNLNKYIYLGCLSLLLISSAKLYAYDDTNNVIDKGGTPAPHQNILEKESVTPPLFHRVAKDTKVPASVLYAIVLAESQSYMSITGKTEPWPWTINHAGEPHYFEKKIDAVIFVRSLINNKDFNFDVGLGQLNWKFHGQQFNSVSDAFNPYLNLTVAAKFLRRQFERQSCIGWKGAIGCYHRPNQTENHHRFRAKKYTKRVLEIWKKLEQRGS